MKSLGLLLILSAFLFTACTSKPAHQANSTPAAASPAPKGTPANIGFKAAKVGEFKNTQEQTIVLYKAIPCDDCDLDYQLVVYNQSLGQKTNMALPGIYYVEEEAIPETEIYGFYGACLDNNAPGVVIVAKEHETYERSFSQTDKSAKYFKTEASFDKNGTPILADLPATAGDFANIAIYKNKKDCKELPREKFQSAGQD